MFTIKYHLILIVGLFFISCSASDENKKLDEEKLSKIKFSLADFNEEGLFGNPDGLRAMDYKFCIPKNESYKEQILNIDKTINIIAGNKNNCSEEEYFCIGNTHKKSFKVILKKLALLDFVLKIEPHYWE